MGLDYIKDKDELILKLNSLNEESRKRVIQVIDSELEKTLGCQINWKCNMVVHKVQQC